MAHQNEEVKYIIPRFLIQLLIFIFLGLPMTFIGTLGALILWDWQIIPEMAIGMWNLEFLGDD